MRNLCYVVNGQSMKRSEQCNFDGVVMGTTNYLQCSFTFDKDWSGTTKVAVFTNQYIDANTGAIPVPIKNGIARIPKEICAGEVIVVYVIGALKDGTRIITNKDIICQKGV